MKDGIGIYGSIFNYSFLFVLFGSTLFMFLYLWYKGLLGMGEGPKYDMMHMDEEEEKK
ncbi:putative uncharacterized protein [Waddlia chondrophila 2032/99]|uniref:Uncharacterized protein n=2 Tax=Waddlia chondrophila TaxID=71667 RepID=D6YTA1_WADCW|nr:hypothetical protein [Waddlia chondrophila]ADI39296.1 hypothetical protein wcw_1963 [Waddlia chondrophila WSU 86-1044]CCB90555.1 putative uncharacterized protein [Waddlia chondrophila 2032/99]